MEYSVYTTTVKCSLIHFLESWIVSLDGGLQKAITAEYERIFKLYCSRTNAVNDALRFMWVRGTIGGEQMWRGVTYRDRRQSVAHCGRVGLASAWQLSSIIQSIQPMLRWLLRHCEQPQTLVAFDRIINRFNLVHKAVTKKSIFVMFFFSKPLRRFRSFPSRPFLSCSLSPDAKWSLKSSWNGLGKRFSHRGGTTFAASRHVPWALNTPKCVWWCI